MTIQFIFFDLGNVLLEFSHDRGCHQMAMVAGISSSQVRRAAFDSGLNERYERGEITTEQFHKEFDRLSNTTTQFDELIGAWNDIFDIHTRTIPIVANLRAAGYPLGIISNTCQAHREHAVKKYPMLTTFFDPFITSFEVKAMKPDAKIYEYAAARVKVAAEEIFFVDDRAENVEGARRCSWHAVQFSGARQLAEDLGQSGVEFNR